jgi:predicted transcriptional regulator
MIQNLHKPPRPLRAVAVGGASWSRMLQNPFRAAILERVEAEPGIRQAELASAMPCSRATVRHHLEALHAAGLLRLVSTRRHAAVFPPSVGAGEGAARAALRRGRTLDVARLVARQPGLSQSEATRQLRMSRRVFRACADRLLAHGLVAERRQGRLSTYLPGPGLALLLAEGEPASGPAGAGPDASHAARAASSG